MACKVHTLAQVGKAAEMQKGKDGLIFGHLSQ
jgi:hypothetical protein